MFVPLYKLTFHEVVTICTRMYRGGFPEDYVNGLYMEWEYLTGSGSYASSRQTNNNPT